MPRKARRGRKGSTKRARARKIPRSKGRRVKGATKKAARSGSRRIRVRGRHGTKPSPTRRTSISRRIESTEKAISTIGERNIKRGSLTLGQTRKLTPTKAGFRAVRRVLSTVNKVSRVGKMRTFTYDLEGTYKGADGKEHEFSRRQVGIPRLRDIKRLKGESAEEALNRVVERRIRLELQGILREKLGGYTIAKAEGEKITPEEAADRLREIKKSRDVKFRLTFRREVSHHEPEPERKKKPKPKPERKKKPKPKPKPKPKRKTKRSR